MVKYVPDRTGRFSQRPHFTQAELDRECDHIITKFLKERHGALTFPISTDDLTCLVERDTEDLDLYADLSSYGPEVEGLTVFNLGRKPSVQISERLAADDRRQNRLRTTLTHEYGHVHYHACLWELEPPRPDLLKQNPHANKQICKRDTMLEARETDWMEWQAGYVCGALLMPVTELRRLVGSYRESSGLFGVIALADSHASALIDAVQMRFQVSAEAARIRLLKLGILGAVGAGPSLFNR